MNTIRKLGAAWVEGLAIGMGLAFACFGALFLARKTGLPFAVALILGLGLGLAAWRTILGLLRLVRAALADGSPLWRAICVGLPFIFGCWLAVNIPLAALLLPAVAGPVLLRAALKGLFIGISGGFLGLLILALTVWFSTFRAGPSLPGRTRPAWGWLRFAIPMVLVWLFYLLVFWPAMMSTDSLIQWNQLLTGRFEDHHPVFSTLFMGLMTRFYFSPAAVAVGQILALALLASAILDYFGQRGVPSAALWLASLLFALTPVNGTMVVTLWKDIPYCISALALTYLILRMLSDPARWPRTVWHSLLLGVAASFAALFRHDGAAVCFGTLAVLPFFFAARRKHLLFALLAAAAIYLGVRGPLYRALGVENKLSEIVLYSSPYTLAGYTTPNGEGEALFQSIRFDSSASWDCQVWNTATAQWQEKNVDMRIGKPQAALNLVRRLPKVLLYLFRCNRSLVWIVWDPSGEVRNPSHVELLIDENPYGLKAQSLFPDLRAAIANGVITSSHTPSLNWFTWRPALFLYVFLFVVWVQAYRRKDLRWLLLALPVLIQCAAFTLIPTAPNFRYHYLVYLLGWLFWPLLLASGTAVQAEHAAQNSRG